MPSPTRKGIFIVLLAMVLVVGVAVVPEKFGEEYLRYLAGIVALGLIVLLFYSTDLRKWLRPGAAQSRAERFNIPPGAATRKQINLSRTAISQAEPEQALRHLSDLKVPALDTEIATLSSRYAEYRRSSRQGINSRDEENRTYNRITKGILDLIKTLESELATGTENYQTIKDYLKKRYTNRLGQKLAKRQPVNLRRIPSTEGTSDDRAAAFIPYSADEVAGTMAQSFRDARGRLLLIGAPGAGKTTLMLQLVLDLLDSEPDALPVLLNLATWSSEYITLEAWLKKILPAELGVSEKYAQEIMPQGRLILLLDGFDEIYEENRADCLEAIGRYGEDASRQFVISSRIDEYKTVAKDAPVHWQIEVGPLSIEQLESELNRLWETENQPEARVLLQAIQKDALLRQSAETPFYFNTLQILFSGGKTLADLHFTAITLEDRQTEILDRFIEYELKVPARQEYPPEKVKHWLSFLAYRMTERNMVVFELRDLQYDWWRWGKEHYVLNWLVFILTEGLICGLGIGLVIGLIDKSWLGGILWTFIFGLIAGIMRIQTYFLPINELAFQATDQQINEMPLIRTRDEIKWYWKNFIKSIWLRLAYIGVFVLLFGLLSAEIVLIVLMFAKGGTISDQTSALVIEYILGLKWLLIYLLCSGLIFGVLSGLWEFINQQPRDILQITTPYQRFHASCYAWHFPILQHKLLCYQLRRQGLLPPDLVKFLNELSLRHILEFDGDPTTGKGGGAWRFRHRILQEWFAGRWVEREEKSKTSP